MTSNMFSFAVLFAGLVVEMSGPSLAQTPIRIGASLSTTGNYSAQGRYNARGTCSAKSM
jgi:hypothetical protein